jgi:hypothetical protein
LSVVRCENLARDSAPLSGIPHGPENGCAEGALECPSADGLDAALAPISPIPTSKPRKPVQFCKPGARYGPRKQGGVKSVSRRTLQGASRILMHVGEPKDHEVCARNDSLEGFSRSPFSPTKGAASPPFPSRGPHSPSVDRPGHRRAARATCLLSPSPSDFVPRPPRVKVRQQGARFLLWRRKVAHGFQPCDQER